MIRPALTVTWILQVLFTLSATALAVDAPRQRVTFDFDWRFTLGDPANAQQASFNDATWTPINLPYDWSIFGPFDRQTPAAGNGAYLPTGVAWYRKSFPTPEDFVGRRVAIEFDGIYENSEVWINNHSLGKRPSGYISFVYDLTPYLNTDGQPNVLAVRVDNSPQPNSRWYTGSGIYRHTWLIVTDELHVPQWGTQVTTPTITADFAIVHAAVQVANEGKSDRSFDIDYTVLDAQGRAVGTKTSHGDLKAGVRQTFDSELTIPKPSLWSVQTPSLYTLRCALSIDNHIIDQYDTPFGIRTAVFDVDKGFLLNGTPVKLNGVCLHGDGGGVGTAVPEGVWARRLKLLKEMGCNAIRTSHNPPAPEFLDLCDQMGFLVMDEAFDQWKWGKRNNDYSHHFTDWWKTDLTDFIRRDRNHPSIIIWSAGNEIGEQVDAIGATLLKPMIDIFHIEDPTRPVTAACDAMDAEPKKTKVEFAKLLDVVGYNYVDRWRKNANTFYANDRRVFLDRKFIGTEVSSISGTRGDYSWLFPAPPTKPMTDGPHRLQPPTSNAHLDIEQLLKFTQAYDYVTGDFMWTGFDYLGEAYWPNKSAPFGPLDSCGFKKDAFYFYQSQWTAEPVLHLFPHWNWQGRDGEIVPVTCYTNCDTVELFLNGKSLGVKGYEFPRNGMQDKYGVYPPRAALVRTTADLHLSWDVPYAPGTLKAVGSFKGKTVNEEIVTTDEPAAIQLSVDPSTLHADALNVAHVTVQIVDAAGRIVPTADNSITFAITGPAKLISVDNGNPASDESFKADHRKTFNGLCLAILQATHEAGSIELTATADGLHAAKVQIQSKAP